MKEHITEAICVIVTSMIAGIIRYFEKKKIKEEKEVESKNHFKKV
jgi:hypothetical protein